MARGTHSGIITTSPRTVSRHRPKNDDTRTANRCTIHDCGVVGFRFLPFRFPGFWDLGLRLRTHAGVVAGSRLVVANNRNRIAIISDWVF